MCNERNCNNDSKEYRRTAGELNNKDEKMQDRFKFRFFNETTGKMVYDVNNHAPQDLMQCTGLKDINGKLIYEGDIFAIHTHFDCLVPDSYEYKYFEEKGISYFKVAYNYDKARFYLIRTKWIKWNTSHTMLDYIPTNHAIAGNIYENPELLEVAVEIKQKHQNADSPETLTGLILQLVEAGELELDKKEVRKVLE